MERVSEERDLILNKLDKGIFGLSKAKLDKNSVKRAIDNISIGTKILIPHYNDFDNIPRFKEGLKHISDGKEDLEYFYHKMK